MSSAPIRQVDTRTVRTRIAGVVLSLALCLLAAAVTAPPAVAAGCSDGTVRVSVWYTPDGWPPEQNDAAGCGTGPWLDVRIGRCYKLFHGCSTNHCDGRDRMYQNAMAEGIRRVRDDYWGEFFGDTNQEQDVFSQWTGHELTCDPMPLWGARIDAGGRTRQVRWRYDYASTLSGSVSSPLVGENGWIYTLSTTTSPFGLAISILRAFDRGTLKWEISEPGSFAPSPAIGPDGTLYVAVSNALRAFDATTGDSHWSLDLTGSWAASPAVGRNGEILVVRSSSSGGVLHAVRPREAKDGADVVWSVELGTEQSWTDPVVAGDGTIYVASAAGVLHQISADGDPGWTFDTEDAIAGQSPAIGADGTIYLGGVEALRAVHADGTSKGVFGYGGKTGTLSSPVVLAEVDDGGSFVQRIYVGTSTGLQAITDGSSGLRYDWFYTTGAPVRTTPSIGADGTIFFGSDDDSLYALDRTTDGEKKKWSLGLGADVVSSPAVGPDRTVYVPAGTTLYAVYGSSALANGVWTTYRGDAQHTGQVRLGVSVAPSSYDFGILEAQVAPPVSFVITNQEAGTRHIHEVRLEDTYGDFGLEAADFDDACPATPFDLGAGDSCEVRVSFATERYGEMSASLIVESDSPQSPQTVARIRGRRPAATIEILGLDSDGTLSFSDASRTVRIANAADASEDLEVRSITVAGEGFSLPLPPPPPAGVFGSSGALFTLEPGESSEPLDLYISGASGWKAAFLNVQSNDPVHKEVSVLLHGRVGYTTSASLIGFVSDQDTDQRVGGARVAIDSASTESSVLATSKGFFKLDDLDAGEDRPLSITSTGYRDLEDAVTLVAGESLIRNFQLEPDCDPTNPLPRITSITSRYQPHGEHVTYVRGISHPVAYTAHVQWCGRMPGKAHFGRLDNWRTTSPPLFSQTDTVVLAPQAPGASATEDATVSHTLDMGVFSSCGALEIWVEDNEGRESLHKRAPLGIMKPVLPHPAGDLLAPAFSDIGDGFRYSVEATPKFFDRGFKVWEKIPIFGGKSGGFKLIPSVRETYESSGNYEVRLAWENLALGSETDTRDPRWQQNTLAMLYKKGLAGDAARIPFGGGSVSLYPMLYIKGTWNDETCSFDSGGELGLTADANASVTGYFLLVGIPMYWKVGFGLQVEADVPVWNVEPDGSLDLAGHITFQPWLKGSLGAGADGILGVEGWVKGGFVFTAPWCEGDDSVLFAEGGVTVYAFLIDWSYSIARVDWDYCGKTPDTLTIVPVVAEGPKLMPRDYVLREGYATFAGDDPTRDAGDGVLTIYSTVFEHSTPDLASTDDGLYLVWVHDNPQKSDESRTELRLLRWDGEAWGEDWTAVAPDETADFHPDLVAFPGGSAAVVWEDMKPVAAGDVDVEHWKANLEVCVSRYEEVESVRAFTPQHCFTDNEHLDHSPRIAGGGPDDLLAVWIENEANDSRGGPDAPNRIRSSRWDGSDWSPPAVVTTVPLPLLEYELAYDGSVGYLVMSVDTEQPVQSCLGDHRTVCEDDAGCDAVGGPCSARMCSEAQGTACATDDECGETGGECILVPSIADRELYALRYDGDGGTWSSADGSDLPQRLTDDLTPDTSPRLASQAGEYVLVWLKDGDLVAVSRLDDWLDDADAVPATLILEEKHSTNLAEFRLAHAHDRLAVLWAQATDQYSDIQAVFYDPDHDTWGAPRPLLPEPDPEIESHLAATFELDDLGVPWLVTVYDRTAVEEREEKLPDGQSVLRLDKVRTDLAMVRHRLGDDLALDEVSLLVDPFSPRPGQQVEIQVDVLNLGERAADEVTVRFYQGEGTGGEVIGEVVVVDPDAAGVPLAPGAFATATIGWVVPDDATEGILVTAEVDPDGSITEDRDRANNVTTRAFGLPDLAVASATWENVGSNRYTISARVVNLGGGTARSESGDPPRVRVAKVGEPNVVILDQAMPELPGSGSFDVDLVYQHEPGPGGTVAIDVIVDVDDAVRELDETNNARRIHILRPDVTPPVFDSRPENRTVECDDVPPPDALTASDDFDGAVEVLFHEERTDGPSPYDYTLIRTWSATDGAGNSATHEQVIVVRDTTPPVLECPEPRTLECLAPTDPVQTGAATATDNCSTVAVDAEDTGEGACGLTEILTRTWTGRDASGNSVSCEQVIDLVDATPPELSLPQAVTFECSRPAGVDPTDARFEAWLEAASASDACGESGVHVDLPDLLGLGENVVPFTASDECGNQSEGEAIVTVVDTVGPILTVPDDRTVECTALDGAPVELGAALVTDACCADGAIAVTNDAPVMLPPGPTVVTWTATDCHGHVTTAQQVVTVVDTTAPTVTLFAEPPRLWPPNHKMTAVRLTVGSSDACSAQQTILLDSVTSSEPDDAPGSSDGETVDDIQGARLGFPDFEVLLRAENGKDAPRVYTITYTATDPSGNVGTGVVEVPVFEERGEPILITLGDPLATTLTWPRVEKALSYDVIRGQLNNLRIDGSHINLGPVSCIEFSSMDATTVGSEDGEVPEPGRAFFYLVQFRDEWEPSSYGTVSTGRARVPESGGCGS